MIVFIIVAAVVMPVIVSPVMTFLKDSTKPEKSVRANFLGQKILEVITANDFPTLTNETPVGTAPAPDIPPSDVETDINNKIDSSWPSGYTKTWSLYYITAADIENKYTTAATDYVRIDITVTDPYGRDFNCYSIVTKRKNDNPAE